MANTKTATIVRSFDDAGTGEHFAAGATVTIDAGTFANYKAAGLVRAARARRTAKAKPKAPRA